MSMSSKKPFLGPVVAVPRGLDGPSLPDTFAIDVELSLDGRRAVLRVAGDLDLATAPRLEEALGRVGDGVTHIELDGRAVSFCDSTGLDVLLSAATRSRALGARFAVTRTSPHLRRLMMLSRLGQELGVSPPGTRSVAHEGEPT